MTTNTNDVSLADTSTAWQSLDFAAAEDGVKEAMEAFKKDKEKYGAAVALAYFNARVDRWVAEFTNPRLARVMNTTGKAMDGSTHSRAISVNGNVRGNREKDDGTGELKPLKLVKGGLLFSYHQRYIAAGPNDTPVTLGYQQFNRYLDKAKPPGIVTREPQGPEGRQGRQGPDGAHPDAWMPNVIHVNFSRVLVGDQVVPHDFNAPLENAPDIADYAEWYAGEHPPADTPPDETKGPFKDYYARATESGNRDGNRGGNRDDPRDGNQSYGSSVACESPRTSVPSAKADVEKSSSRGEINKTDRRAQPPRTRFDAKLDAQNVFMVRPTTGYYYKPEEVKKHQPGDQKVALSQEEARELFDRDCNPTQKDRMVFMKTLLATLAWDRAARIRAEHDAEDYPEAKASAAAQLRAEHDAQTNAVPKKTSAVPQMSPGVAGQHDVPPPPPFRRPPSPAKRSRPGQCSSGPPDPT